MTRRAPLVIAPVIVLGLASCSDADRRPEPKPEPTPRRVIEPPEGLFRAVIPYAIRADGVGPYKPGDSMESMQEQLRDVRIARIDLPGQASLIRVDNEAIIIGGDPSTASTVTFIGVLGGREVARTDKGISVGSSRSELVRAHGPEVDDLERASDPSLVAVTGMRPARFVIDRERDRIVAIVIGVEPRAPKRIPDVGPPTEPVCARPPSPASPRGGRAFGACLTGIPEIVETEGDEVTVRPYDRARGTDADHATFAFRIPNLVFAAALRNASEQRDELIAITRTDDPQQRVWSVSGYRFEGKTVTKAIDATPVYQLSQTRWSGELRDIDLYFELTSHAEGIEVGGILTSRGTRGEEEGKGIRAVVSIARVAIARRHGRSSGTEPGDAGVHDGEPSGDASPAPHDAGARTGSNSPKP